MGGFELAAASPADEALAAAGVRAVRSRRMGAGDDRRIEDLVEAVTGAMSSIAAMVEQSQARLPFYVETHGAQTFTGTTSGQVYKVQLQPLAAQLVRVTGIVAVAWGSTANEVGQTTLQLGNTFPLPVPNVLATSLSVAALVIPSASFFLDTISQGPYQTSGNLQLSCTAGDTHNLALGCWLWGEQVPATGMVG